MKDSSASVERTLIMSATQQYGSTLSTIGTLGMAKSMSGNTINYSSWIDFNPTNSTLTLNSDSGTYVKSTQKVDIVGNQGIVLEATGSGRTIEHYSPRHNFRTSQGGLAEIFIDLTDSSFPKLGVGSHSFLTNRISPNYLNLMNGTSHTDYGNLSLAKIDATEVKYTSLVNNSTRDIKTGIRPMEVDALAMVNSLQVREYYMKEDFFNLQNRRMETDETLTLNDIKLYYGLIVDETPDVLVSEGKDGVLPYSIISLNLKATQQLDVKITNQGTEIANLKAEIEAGKLEKVSMQTQIDELKVLVQQLLNR